MARGHIVLIQRDTPPRGTPQREVDYATPMYFLCALTFLNLIFACLVYICYSTNQQLVNFSPNTTDDALRVRLWYACHHDRVC
jgi:hypothetical protein